MLGVLPGALGRDAGIRGAGFDPSLGLEPGWEPAREPGLDDGAAGKAGLEGGLLVVGVGVGVGVGSSTTGNSSIGPRPLRSFVMPRPSLPRNRAVHRARARTPSPRLDGACARAYVRAMGLLDGKVAIITGAGNGIGRAHALLLAKEGAKVVVNDLGGTRDGAGTSESAANKVCEEIKAAGGTGAPSYDDVSTAAGASGIVKRATDAFGRADILVNNAGILRDKSFLKMDEAMFDAVVAVHLKGTFLCSQAFTKQIVAQNAAIGAGGGGGGRIVNTTSVSGMLGNFGQANYAAAKAGIYGLTRTCSIELQKHRITVNAIAPIAKTRMTEDLPMFQGVDTMTAEHIAPVALFLASDLCGDRTGHVVAVAGARLYAFKVIETAGKFKETGNGVWTPQEIADNWDAFMKS